MWEKAGRIIAFFKKDDEQGGGFKKWLASWKPSTKSPEEIAAENEKWWFEEYLPAVEPSWDKRLANRKRFYPSESAADCEREATKYVLAQAQTEYDKLDKELDKGLARSNVIVGSSAMIAALILGLVTIVITQKVSINLPSLMAGATFIAAAFLLTMLSMRPPLRRAISEPYVDQAEWTVLVVSDFTKWAMLTYSCRSRQRINTRYKVLHGAAITVFMIGVAFLFPAFSGGLL